MSYHPWSVKKYAANTQTDASCAVSQTLSFCCRAPASKGQITKIIFFEKETRSIYFSFIRTSSSPISIHPLRVMIRPETTWKLDTAPMSLKNTNHIHISTHHFSVILSLHSISIYSILRYLGFFFGRRIDQYQRGEKVTDGLEETNLPVFSLQRFSCREDTTQSFPQSQTWNSIEEYIRFQKAFSPIFEKYSTVLFESFERGSLQPSG